ncbi:iron-siderophore ABC transporter substrate-binding protein [Nocardiopsis lambiniae]|uniref:Iron-siderophore ABC transporter substrate-binding protein n=1 Tax=Nocardiopsis lambiniae TaxID=3075539 RepID=A0ABU2M9E1_9ACTN|nr:iron-siderophore ABC transporter substrate-binding protein [Nocardiopsis sp. DSM 44743]MDT0329295.1 iron-siderophore ABC transporter substrate-binding protein [Nocardiopsis sp. DSM 44743]
MTLPPRMRRLTPPSIAAAVTVAMLTACGASGPGGNPEATNEPTDGYPRTVEHFLGSTEIPAAPERVLPLDAAYVDSTLALGGNVVGFTTFAEDVTSLPEYLVNSDWNVGTSDEAVPVGLLWDLDPELVASTDPDLILSAQVRHGDGYEQFSEVAPTVMSETTGATWKENLVLTGAALDAEEEAGRLVTEFEERAAALGEAIVEANGGEAPTVSVARFAGDAEGVRLYTPKSYIGVILEDLGLEPGPGVETEAEDIVTYHSQERLLDLDAEYIFVATYDDGGADGVQESKEEYMSAPLWSELEGGITEVNDEYWISGVGLIAAHAVLDDVAEIFDVDPQR